MHLKSKKRPRFVMCTTFSPPGAKKHSKGLKKFPLGDLNLLPRKESILSEVKSLGESKKATLVAQERPSLTVHSWEFILILFIYIFYCELRVVFSRLWWHHWQVALHFCPSHNPCCFLDFSCPFSAILFLFFASVDL